MSVSRRFNVCIMWLLWNGLTIFSYFYNLGQNHADSLVAIAQIEYIRYITQSFTDNLHSISNCKCNYFTTARNWNWQVRLRLPIHDVLSYAFYTELNSYHLTKESETISCIAFWNVLPYGFWPPFSVSVHIVCRSIRLLKWGCGKISWLFCQFAVYQ